MKELHFNDGTDIKYSQINGVLKISCPGSTDWKDIKNVLTPCMQLTPFGKIDYSINKSAINAFIEIFDPSRFPKRVEISGHSLGGGVAQALAFQFLTHGIRVDLLTLQGSIRICNSDLKNFLEKNVIEIKWIENGNDPVPLFPIRLKTVGKKIILKERKFPWIDFDLVNGDHMGYWK